MRIDAGGDVVMGFAQMAWKLAKQRAGVPLLPLCFTPDRVHALRSPGGSSWRYYQIIDRVEFVYKFKKDHDVAIAFIRL
jgi:hypothetical protein